MASLPPQPQRASNDDIWLHHALFKNEITPLGKIHPKFFENKFKKPRNTEPWALEISGRLHSLARDIESFATRRAELLIKEGSRKNASFLGIIYQNILKIRNIDDKVYDVFHKPTYTDYAHSNLVRMTDFPIINGVIPHAIIRNLTSNFLVALVGSSNLRRLVAPKKV